MRFIAAMMVFGHHVVLPVLQNNLTSRSPLFMGLAKTIFSGNSGVSLFFVLSGFLITYLLLEEKQSSHTIHIRSFYQRRIRRIWPLYMAVLFFSFVIYPLLRQLSHHEYVSVYHPWMHLLFLSNFDIMNASLHHMKETNLFTDITWSVAIEEQFYLFWPWIVLLRKNISFWMMLVLVFLSLGFRYYHADSYFILKFHSISTLVDLSIGGIMAWCTYHFRTWKNFFGNLGLSSQLVGIIIVFGIIYLLENDILHGVPYALMRLPLAIGFALIIAQQAFVPLHSKAIQLFRWKYASKLGVVTYGIYLLHPIVLWLVANILEIFSLSEKSILGIILTYILTISAAWYSYYHVERRIMGKK